MKKIVITLFLVLFTSSVYAGACPNMAKSVDDMIVENTNLSNLERNLAIALRDQGVAAHEAGDHSKSEDVFNNLMGLLKS